MPTTTLHEVFFYFEIFYFD